MKKIIVILISFLLLLSCKDSNEDKGYLIQGYITGYFEGKVVLAKYQNGKMINLDSVFMTKSIFKFKNVKIQSPELYYLIVDDGKIVIEFFTDKNHIQINADFNKNSKLEVQGSMAHNEYVSFLENNVVFEDKQKEIYKQRDIALTNNDTSMLAALDSMFTATYKEQTDFIYSYVTENNSSFVSAYIALRSLSDHIGLEQLEEITLNFSDTVRTSIYYKELKDKINVIKRTAIGMQAPNFSLPDTAEKSVSLSSMQGKYVFLDFSSSWHGPSRSRNPLLIKIYNNYKNKGFEIYQASLERNKDEWKKIIETDGINWITVSDIKGLESDVINLYGIRSLPKSFLLDKRGVIISKDLNPEELDKTLRKLL